MSEYKVTHRVYTAWNYETEVDDLNQKSREGWQLIYGGCYHSKFEKDTGVVYRYQIDFHPKLENKVRYVEMFQEQGWQLINSTYNGWHYFRKLYDESLDEEEYEIYTDESSKMELTKRWNRMCIGITSFFAFVLALMVIRMIQEPSLERIPLLILYIVMTSIMGKGMYMMKKRNSSKRGNGDKHLFQFLGLFGLVCIVIMEVMIFNRPHISANYYSDTCEVIEGEQEYELGQFNVSYPDFYYLDLKINMKSPVDYAIVNEAGKKVFKIRGELVDKENIRIPITPGNYKIVLMNFEGGNLEVHYSLD